MQNHARSGRKSGRLLTLSNSDPAETMRVLLVRHRLRTELEANFSVSQPTLYLWLEDTPSDNQWTHLGALAPVHTHRPSNSREQSVDKARHVMVKTACTFLGNNF